MAYISIFIFVQATAESTIHFKDVKFDLYTSYFSLIVLPFILNGMVSSILMTLFKQINACCYDKFHIIIFNQQMFHLVCTFVQYSDNFHYSLYNLERVFVVLTKMSACVEFYISAEGSLSHLLLAWCDI